MVGAKDKRTRGTMYMDFLAAVKREQDKEGIAKPTRAMYGASFCSKQFKRVMGELEGAGIVEYVDMEVDRRTNRVISFKDSYSICKVLGAYKMSGMRGVLEMYRDLPDGLKDLLLP